MNFKMYRFVCLILLVNMSITISTNTIAGPEPPTFTSSPVNASHGSSTQITSANSIESTNNNSITTIKTMENTSGTTQTQSNPPTTPDGCLINLNDKKDLLLWSIISLLGLICLLLLMIIMCMACKCCRGVGHNEVVMLKSSTSVRRNSVNGGPSETDVLLKDCSSVKVEMETTLAESEKPEEVGGADANEVENQDTTEENKNSANDTSEAAPTQEADQSAQTDLKTEASENAE